MEDHAFAQHFVECSKCKENVEFYCKICKLDLCESCKEKHSRDKISTSHTILLYQEKFGSGIVEETCRIHKDEVYRHCCQQCGIPVCGVCKEDFKHKKHSFINLENAYHESREKHERRVSKITGEILPQCLSMQRDIQVDLSSRRDEIGKILSVMMSKALNLKSVIDSVMEENTKILEEMCDAQELELTKQDHDVTDCITHLMTVVNGFDQPSNKSAEFIFYHLAHSSEIDSVPQMPDVPLPLMTDVNITKDDVIKLLGQIKSSTATTNRKARNHRYISYEAPPLKIMDAAEKVKSIKVRGIRDCYQISHVSSEKFWLRDEGITLSDMSGKSLHRLCEVSDEWAIQSVSREGELIFIDNKTNICKLSPDNKRKATLIQAKDPWKACSVYSSFLTGDILVGLVKTKQASKSYSNLKAKVVQFSQSGHEIFAINRDSAGQSLYRYPRYVTENRNGDVVTSDHSQNAVVVTDHRGKHRFSYTGSSSSSEFWPRGICTDALMNILVCDYKTDTVHLIDKNGNFLRLILQFKDEMEEPCCLNCDEESHLLWVGCRDSKRVSVFKYLSDRSQ